MDDNYTIEELNKLVKKLQTELDHLRENSIEFGRDYWSDRYDISEKIWVDDFGVPRAKSFCMAKQVEMPLAQQIICYYFCHICL